LTRHDRDDLVEILVVHVISLSSSLACKAIIVESSLSHLMACEVVDLQSNLIVPPASPPSPLPCDHGCTGYRHWVVDSPRGGLGASGHCRRGILQDEAAFVYSRWSARLVAKRREGTFELLGPHHCLPQQGGL
jgi:hypothetical protein